MSAITSSLLAIGLLSAAGPAAAEAVSLSCPGVTIGQADSVRSFRLSSNPDAQMAASAALARAGEPSGRLVRTAGHMAVRLDGETARIQPAGGVAWYDLADVKVTDQRITGFAPFGDQRSARVKLSLDRRSGDIRFGDFNGACKASGD